MPASRTYAGHELAVDGTLRRITVLFRLLGWIWLMILADLTLPDDPEASAPIVIATMGAPPGEATQANHLRVSITLCP